MAAAVETNELTRSFGDEIAVDGLSFDIEAGEVVALLGPNGAGKTTTVRLLNGLLTPDRGSSRVLGLDPAAQGDEVRRRTGVMTDRAVDVRSSLHPGMPVRVADDVHVCRRNRLVFPHHRCGERVLASPRGKVLRRLRLAEA